MRDFFEASMALELHDNAAAQTLYQRLAADFPASGYVATQSATAQYGLRAFDAAASAFESIARAEPFRLEGMDTYSNILYVKEATAALSGLAHDAVATDKYRPETCCIVGNYYSLKGAHDKAVLYFRRALKLNPAYLSAWTLMGHEYVEMKNLGAAVEAYRAAVALSPRDYRAWYGLGQTYELLGLPLYALHYYGRAAALRPGDARMWCAIGQCYESEQLGRADAAVRCYRRALANDDREGIALAKLAKLHANMGQREEAAHFHRLNLQRLDDEHAEGAELIEALQFLAQYAKESGSLQEAEKYCTRLLDFGGPAKEAAKGLLREIRTAAMGAMEISPSS
jgi:anaphase-promoting complex subunit 8